jgi:hypothetical protein
LYGAAGMVFMWQVSHGSRRSLLAGQQPDNTFHSA